MRGMRLVRLGGIAHTASAALAGLGESAVHLDGIGWFTWSGNQTQPPACSVHK